MKIIAIHQPQYLPYLGFFHKLVHCDVFVALDHIQFQKNGLQNRNKIKTSQGWQWLTVPVLHRFGQLINEVQINNEVSWNRKHWSALVSNYSSAPYYEMYCQELKRFFEMKWRNLCELNMVLIHWAKDLLDIKTPILYSSALGVEGNQTKLLINICKALEAEHYLSGPGGKEYMDTSLFKNAGINVIWQEYVSPVYPQGFSNMGFMPNLSVVDVLFCCGPNTARFLE